MYKIPGHIDGVSFSTYGGGCDITRQTGNLKTDTNPYCMGVTRRKYCCVAK
jgi:hypothetical protein